MIILGGLMASLLLAGWIVRPFLVPLTWAAILVGVCRPWTGRVTARLGGRRRVAAVITCLTVSAVIILPLTFLVVVLSRESVSAYQHMQELLQSEVYESAIRRRWDALAAWIHQASQGIVDWRGLELRSTLLEAMQHASGFLVSLSSGLMSRFVAGVLQLLLMIATMYFLFVDGPALLARIQAIIPLSPRQQRVLLTQFTEVSTVVITGSFLTAVGQGILGGLGFWVLGLPSPVLWGATMGAASLIPVVGSGLIWFPTAAYLILSGDMVRGLVLLGLGCGVLNLVDNVVRIFILGGRMRMHILLVFLSILGGLQAFGFIGLVLGPLIIVMFQTFFLFYEAELRKPPRRQASGAPERHIPEPAGV